MIYITLLCVSCILLCHVNGKTSESFRTDLHAASVLTNEIIRNIYTEWRIDKYPLFLKSCFMHKSSWELMKLKYMYAILSREVSNVSKDFVISFLGSSVAAGHDSMFNQSYPIVVGSIMSKAFKALNINLVTKNMALGNNPCVPYDICVKLFAGMDADIVQWEQTYNCPNDPPVMEQFVRQSLLIPSKPIVVFSESHTGTWKSEDCIKLIPKQNLTVTEKELLQSPPLSLVSTLNKDEFKRAWGSIHEITRLYGAAGIQTFTHTRHEKYKCQGPYVPEWQSGAARWHPSFRSHRLRASQMSYFWLSAWRDAIDELHLEAHSRSMEDMLKETVRKLHAFYYHSYQHSQDVAKRHHHELAASRHGSNSSISSLLPGSVGVEAKNLVSAMTAEQIHLPGHIYPSLALDGVQCFTDYEPRPVRESSLRQQVIAGISTESSGKGWKSIIYENLVSPALVKKSMSRGYLDFKHLLYGNKDSGPLSLAIHPKQIGPVLICETPGIWGSLPKGFDHIWSTNTQVYIGPAATSTSRFEFDSSQATLHEFFHRKNLEICMQSKTNVTIGRHVMTILPRNESNIIIAWLIIP